MDTFGAIICHRRKELRLTQEKLANIIGCSPNYISILEKNQRNPGSDLIRKLANALGLDEGELWLAANPEALEFIGDRLEGAAHRAVHTSMLNFHMSCRRQHPEIPDEVVHAVAAAISALPGRGFNNTQILAMCYAILAATRMAPSDI